MAELGRRQGFPANRIITDLSLVQNLWLSGVVARISPWRPAVGEGVILAELRWALFADEDLPRLWRAWDLTAGMPLAVVIRP